VVVLTQPTPLTFDALDLIEHFLVLFRVLPFLIPVDAGPVLALHRLRGSFQDELGNVFIGWALDSTVCEITNDVLTVVADWAKVESVASRIEGKDHVELLNEDGRRLVNSADNGLTR
jgi:hypothetical protein